MPSLLLRVLSLLSATLMLGLAVAPTHAADPPLKVVTTVAPLADLVRQIAADRVELVQMVPDGTDSHTFEPRPSDVRYLQQADLIIVNGLHLETPTLELANANKRPETPYLYLGDNTITPEQWIFDFSFPASEGDPNPHLWLDVAFAKNYALVIKDQLSQMDPDNATFYQQNFDALAARLDTLDQAIFLAVESVPVGQRKLLTYHDSWAYFGQRYGVEILGAIQPSDFSEPSPREVANLIDQVRLHQVPVVFGSEVYPSRVLEVIGRETGARFVDTLSDDALPGQPGDPNHTYLGMMVDNMRVMFSNLGGRIDVFDAIDPTSVN
jgi:zinc/manganese transport system substrate-binding protein